MILIVSKVLPRWYSVRRQSQVCGGNSSRGKIPRTICIFREPLAQAGAVLKEVRVHEQRRSVVRGGRVPASHELLDVRQLPLAARESVLKHGMSTMNMAFERVRRGAGGGKVVRRRRERQVEQVKGVALGSCQDSLQTLLKAFTDESVLVALAELEPEDRKSVV